MAERPGVVGNIIKNPTIVVLVIVLALLIAGYAANFYFVNRDSQRVDAYVHYASELKVLSQEVAKNAAAAMDGQTDAFDALAKNRNRFDTNLGYLKDGNPVEV